MSMWVLASVCQDLLGSAIFSIGTAVLPSRLGCRPGLLHCHSHGSASHLLHHAALVAAFIRLLMFFLLAEFSVQLSFVFILLIFAAALIIIILLAVQRHHWLHLRGPHKGREFLRALRLVASTRSCVS